MKQYIIHQTLSLSSQMKIHEKSVNFNLIFPRIKTIYQSIFENLALIFLWLLEAVNYRDVQLVSGELKQTTKATGTETSPNERFNESNNSCARAL